MSGDSRDAFRAAWAAVEGQWQQTRAHWRDEVALEFEVHHWREIRQRTELLQSAAQALDDLLESALRHTG